MRTPQGGFLFGRATDTDGHIEGIHDHPESPAGLLVDECKSIADGVLDALERCHTGFRFFVSSTGPAFGGFYQIMTTKAHLWRTFRVTSSVCPHVNPAEIAVDRLNLKDSVFRIKHAAEFLYDAGDSMVSLEHVRDLFRNPPPESLGAVSGLAVAAALSTWRPSRFGPFMFRHGPISERVPSSCLA